jgi:hypothetical protein
MDGQTGRQMEFGILRGLLISENKTEVGRLFVVLKNSVCGGSCLQGSARKGDNRNHKSSDERDQSTRIKVGHGLAIKLRHRTNSKLRCQQVLAFGSTERSRCLSKSLFPKQSVEQIMNAQCN